MAGLNKFDPRIEALVIETRTEWDPDVGELSAEDQQWLASAIHASPDRASKILYERAHTGFTRIVTVTIDDIQRIYQENAAG